jgi:uncharacterized protein (DUF2126 family)
VKLKGASPGRYVLACNRRRVPLRATGTQGEYVAGVRFKAWAPPSGLHPTISVQAPLTFDVVDTWNRHTIAGCTYHVRHPGGRTYDTFPVNANEAEARRISRFSPTATPPVPWIRHPKNRVATSLHAGPALAAPLLSARIPRRKVDRARSPLLRLK